VTINEFIVKIKEQPENIEFTEVINTIRACYKYTPTLFRNGKGSNVIVNKAGTNEGSCKIFAFGKLNQLDANQTLACFGKYYREDVLAQPDNTDHTNIRTFMIYGWEGITIEGNPLTTLPYLTP